MRTTDTTQRKPIENKAIWAAVEAAKACQVVVGTPPEEAYQKRSGRPASGRTWRSRLGGRGNKAQPMSVRLDDANCPVPIITCLRPARSAITSSRPPAGASDASGRTDLQGRRVG
jgi:hypothetical protein